MYVGSSTNVLNGSNSLINNLNRSVRAANIATTQASTGNKINSAADGASKWAISQKMRTMIRAQSQAIENAQTDTALIKTAQDGLGNQLEILNTLRERAINAANDSNTSSDRAKIAAEAKELLAQFDDIANKTSFNEKYLLNGGVDSGSSVGATTPTGVTATGTYGNMAVYSVTGLSTKGGSAVTDATELINLVGKNGETLFQKGDKVTLSWTENGASKSYDVMVDGNTKLEDLDGGSVTATFATSGTALNAADANGTKLKAGADGLYFEGAANTNISNFSIAVTSGAGATRTAAQEAFQPTAIQQSYGNKGQGSNVVYNLAASNISTNHTTSGTNTAANSNSSAFYQFGTTGTAATNDNSSTMYTLEVDGQKIDFAGSSSINDINKMLKESGINVRLQYTATDKETLYYDGTAVTQGTYGSTMAYQSTAGLNIIAAPGQTPSAIKLTADSTGSKFKSGGSVIDTAATGTTNKTSLSLELDTTETGTSSTVSSELPSGNNFNFQVGADANFRINYTMRKSTVGTVLGMSAEHFASMLTTSEGARNAIGILESGTNKVHNFQTSLGSMENRLGLVKTNNEDSNTNLQTAVDGIVTADLAAAMVNFTKNMIGVQAGQGLLGQLFNYSFTNVNSLIRP